MHMYLTLKLDMIVCCVQLCVEKCPDRHLTLVKAKVGNKEDREYYKQFCKEGVDFATMVNNSIFHFIHILYMLNYK